MTPVRPTTEPTERSMPPVRMTKVMPIATMTCDDRLVQQIEKIVRLEEVRREQRQSDRDDNREHQHPEFEAVPN